MIVLPSPVEKRVHMRCCEKSLPLLMEKTTRTPFGPGGEERSIACPSPSPFATTLATLPGLTTATFTSPPVGASLLTYLATVALFTAQGDGMRKAPTAESASSS